MQAFLFAWFVSLFPSFLSAFLGAPAPHSFAKATSLKARGGRVHATRERARHVTGRRAAGLVPALGSSLNAGPHLDRGSASKRRASDNVEPGLRRSSRQQPAEDSR